MSFFVEDMKGMGNWFLSGFNYVFKMFIDAYYDGGLKVAILFFLALFFFIFPVAIIAKLWWSGIRFSEKIENAVLLISFLLALFFFIYFAYCSDVYRSAIEAESISCGDAVFNFISGKELFI